VQATSVPSERVFSSSAETNTKRRNRLSPALMEALQMLKFNFKKTRLNFMAEFQSVPELDGDEDWLRQLAGEADEDSQRKVLREIFDDSELRDLSYFDMPEGN
jgi:hypothetical protein